MLRTYLIASLVLLAGCADAEPECPSEASSCPDGCGTRHGERLDGDCLRFEIAGCHLPIPSTVVSPAIVHCALRRRDGAVFIFPSITSHPNDKLDSASWAPCSDEQNAAARAARACEPANE